MQSSHDVKLRGFADTMKSQGILSSVFVDRFCVTNVKIKDADAPIAIKSLDDFSPLFVDDEQQAMANKILNGEITRSSNRVTLMDAQ